MARTRQTLPNNDIRKAALLADVRHWEICERLGISEPTLTRWLRFDLPADKRQCILDAITELSCEQGNSREG